MKRGRRFRRLRPFEGGSEERLDDRLEAVVSDRCFGGKAFVLLIGYRQDYGSMVAWFDRIAGAMGFRSRPL